jgi:hypothetical protein
MKDRRTASWIGCLLSILAMSVSACGGDDTAPPPAHPRLECVGDEKGFNPPAFTDNSGPGAATADTALRAELERLVEVFGTGNVEMFSVSEYGVSVDGRVVMVRRATANPDGDWHVVDHYYCSTDETGERLVLAGSE